MKDPFDIFVIGVGGQGIGLLSEVLVRAIDHAGMRVKGCDTHGLAQRGGIVTSHIRAGSGAHSPLVSEGCADLAIALERHEALRAAERQLRTNGTLVWYDAVMQPLPVRLALAAEVSEKDVRDAAGRKGAACVRVFRDGLPDARMQNMAIVAEVLALGLVPGLGPGHVRLALADLLSGPSLESNLALLPP